ncbi:23S rRNA (uracil(1939)-C(5))-methyltransferase [Halothiobacillus diazotrophicus]|uniref:23S rRNA (uracil(1939)-C(5))-methyltransferase RlmD n=1 Tax=Halothiobacillus diazotrophicus TaxID=1860122 RepID=A0A191ZFY8_9GAMM|nr:23S rRNA (uracil(1939)-C(5))-methyltransferase RlmD [Halothiobacillus diazotrophicus]ANJ66783.1 23S rRNA (uracil(1939)-C(5))-methyltransferase [Halothiobacillus diazotrophicus]
MRFPKLPKGEYPAEIESLTLEGRGVSHINGKATFISRALPGETVRFVYTNRKKHFDEGDAVAVDIPSPDRITPACPHIDQCGGCSMQHLTGDKQLAAKEQALLDNLARIGKVTPETILPALSGALWGYRRKARLGVKYVAKKERVLVGFRERHTHFLANLDSCVVLDPRVGERLTDIGQFIHTLDARDRIAQIEVACGDDHVALVFRHLDPLSPGDKEKLRTFGETEDFDIYLQPGGTDSVHPLDKDRVRPLIYRHPAFDVAIEFHPLDFIQVNGEINRAMIIQALQWLDVQPEDRVLDLFAGLGNFTLPLARQAAHVTAVELDEPMARRGAQSAANNGITNTEHVVGNLFEPDRSDPWMQQTYDRVLLDPPRAGAEAMMPEIARFAPKRIVYVSCHPGTLARDAHILVHQHGYRLRAVGVMDMFPHTGHIESMAVFEHPKA